MVKISSVLPGAECWEYKMAGEERDSEAEPILCRALCWIPEMEMLQLAFTERETVLSPARSKSSITYTHTHTHTHTEDSAFPPPPRQEVCIIQFLLSWKLLVCHLEFLDRKGQKARGFKLSKSSFFFFPEEEKLGYLEQDSYPAISTADFTGTHHTHNAESYVDPEQKTKGIPNPCTEDISLRFPGP